MPGEEVEYLRDETQYDVGLAAPRNDINLVAPLDVRYQEPNDYQNETGWAGSLFFTKAWRGGTVYNLTFRSVFHDDERKAFESASIVNNADITKIAVARRDRLQINERQYNFADTSVRRTDRTGSVSHTWMVGLNGGYELSDFNRQQFATNASLNVNLYNPVYGAPGLPPTPTTWQRSEYYNVGIYAQDQIVSRAARSPTRRWTASCARSRPRENVRRRHEPR